MKIKEINKTWNCCTDCPMNYDGLDCHVYPEKFDAWANICDHTKDPYITIPSWCEVETIKFIKKPNPSRRVSDE